LIKRAYKEFKAPNIYCTVFAQAKGQQNFVVQYLHKNFVYAKTLFSGTVTLSVRGSTNGSLGHCNNYKAQIDLNMWY